MRAIPSWVDLGWVGAPECSRPPSTFDMFFVCPQSLASHTVHLFRNPQQNGGVSLTTKGDLTMMDMPVLMILHLNVASAAAHSNIKATAYRAEIITNSFLHHDSYVALCESKARLGKRCGQEAGSEQCRCPLPSTSIPLSY